MKKKVSCKGICPRLLTIYLSSPHPPHPPPILRTSMDSIRRAVVCLTRGYPTLREYSSLISRNQSISRHCHSSARTEYDFLIFHEGNIPPHHQSYIQQKSPHLPLTFVDVSSIAFDNVRKGDAHRPFLPATNAWPTSYRHMCHFWFVDFWECVQSYDEILRIDEDCLVEFPIPQGFALLRDRLAIFGKWAVEPSFVVDGLSAYVSAFLKEQPSLRPPSKIRGPYSNVLFLNVQRLREIPLVMDFVQSFRVNQGALIYKNRWGDLPLWGQVFDRLLPPHPISSVLLLSIPRLPYYHGSHRLMHGSPEDEESQMPPHRRLRRLRQIQLL